jgi:hypothetical protein
MSQKSQKSQNSQISTANNTNLEARKSVLSKQIAEYLKLYKKTKNDSYKKIINSLKKKQSELDQEILPPKMTNRNIIRMKNKKKDIMNISDIRTLPEISIRMERINERLLEAISEDEQLKLRELLLSLSAKQGELTRSNYMSKRSKKSKKEETSTVTNANPQMELQTKMKKLQNKLKRNKQNLVDEHEKGDKAKVTQITHYEKVIRETELEIIELEAEIKIQEEREREEKERKRRDEERAKEEKEAENRRSAIQRSQTNNLVAKREAKNAAELEKQAAETKASLNKIYSRRNEFTPSRREVKKAEEETLDLQLQQHNYITNMNRLLDEFEPQALRYDAAKTNDFLEIIKAIGKTDYENYKILLLKIGKLKDKIFNYELNLTRENFNSIKRTRSRHEPKGPLTIVNKKAKKPMTNKKANSTNTKHTNKSQTYTLIKGQNATKTIVGLLAVNRKKTNLSDKEIIVNKKYTVKGSTYSVDMVEILPPPLYKKLNDLKINERLTKNEDIEKEYLKQKFLDNMKYFKKEHNIDYDKTKITDLEYLKNYKKIIRQIEGKIFRNIAKEEYNETIVNEKKRNDLKIQKEVSQKSGEIDEYIDFISEKEKFNVPEQKILKYEPEIQTEEPELVRNKTEMELFFEYCKFFNVKINLRKILIEKDMQKIVLSLISNKSKKTKMLNSNANKVEIDEITYKYDFIIKFLKKEKQEALKHKTQ